MKKPNPVPEVITPEFAKLYSQGTIIRNVTGIEYSPYANLELARLAARNQEKRVLQLLSCGLS